MLIQINISLQNRIILKLDKVVLLMFLNWSLSLMFHIMSRSLCFSFSQSLPLSLSVSPSPCFSLPLSYSDFSLFPLYLPLSPCPSLSLTLFDVSLVSLSLYPLFVLSFCLPLSPRQTAPPPPTNTHPHIHTDLGAYATDFLRLYSR